LKRSEYIKYKLLPNECESHFTGYIIDSCFTKKNEETLLQKKTFYGFSKNRSLIKLLDLLKKKIIVCKTVSRKLCIVFRAMEFEVL
jgi:hypothetical protein